MPPTTDAATAFDNDPHCQLIVQEWRRIRDLNGLAGACLFVATRLQSPFTSSRSAEFFFKMLKKAAEQLPPLPLDPDPFHGKGCVEVAGLTTTSWHAAMMGLAAKVWQAAHERTLGECVSATEHEDEKGGHYQRYTFEGRRQAPTEVDWSPEAWRRIQDNLKDLPSLDEDRCKAELALERDRANRRLEKRHGIHVTEDGFIKRLEHSPSTNTGRTQKRTGRPRKEESDKVRLVIGALVAHHKWQPDGSVGHDTPAKVSDLATLASGKRVSVSKATVSRFFKTMFPGGGHKGYATSCVRGEIGAKLALWQGVASELLADLRPEEYGRRQEED